MIVERELAGITLPFASGTFIAAYLPAQHSITPLLFLLAASAGAVALIHPKHKRLSNNVLTFTIVTTLACCGLFSGLSQNHLSASSPTSDDALSGYASEFGSSLTDLINDLPFEDKQSNAVVSALITGNRQALSVETEATFRNSGASHILALSGLHLGIIYGILKAVFALAGNRRRTKITKSILIIALCGFYTLATGANDSIVRAFLFILLGETASLTGRFQSIGSILMAALLIQLLITPESAKNAGFQLSYAAMAGIAYIYPWFKGMWTQETKGEDPVRRFLRWIWNSASISIACQITTGPIAYLYFGTFPQYFLLTNLIALPIVGILIPIAVLTIMLEACGISSTVLIQITESLVNVLCDSLSIISSL